MDSNTERITNKEIGEFDIDFNIELDEDIEILYQTQYCSGVLYKIF